MKCTCIALLACFCSLSYVNAQRTTGVTKGSLYISPALGIGRIGNYSDHGSPVWKHYGTDLKMPLVTASFDIALTDYITVGPFIGYAVTGESQSSILYNYSYTYRCTHILVGAKNAFHFRMSGRFTGYTGVSLGLHLAKEKSVFNQNGNDQTTTHKQSRLFYNVFIGSKYHISDGAAIFAELGYGITWGNIGLSLKVH